MVEQLVEAWQINHRVTIRLLDTLLEDALRATLSTRGGRDVARQLAHVHEVRVRRVEGAGKAFASDLPHFDKGESPAKEKLKSLLNASAAAVEKVIRHSWEQDGRVAGFRRGVIPLVAYLIEAVRPPP
jgi:hypothetical protein